MTTTPIHNLTDTWNDIATTFNAIKMNVTDTASADASKLFLLQVGGTDVLAVDKSGAFQDSLFALADNADRTKKVQFQVSGVTTGNTRVLTVPDYDGTIATLAGTETFTNKTIDSANNTLTLDLSEGTLTGTLAEFNTALSDGSFASLAGSETLTNKTIDLTSNTLVGSKTEFNTALESDTFLMSSDLLDEDDMASNSATAPPSQQSVKAYVDAEVEVFSVDTVTAARALTAGEYDAIAVQSTLTTSGDFGNPVNANNLGLFYWDSTSKKTDDGVRYLKPSALATTDAGRWVRQNTVDADYGDSPLPLEDHLRDVYGVHRAAPIRRSVLENAANRAATPEILSVTVNGAQVVVNTKYRYMQYQAAATTDTIGAYSYADSAAWVDFREDYVGELRASAVGSSAGSGYVTLEIVKLATPGSTLTINTVAEAAGVITVTTTGSHGLTTGDIVFITGAAGTIGSAINLHLWMITSTGATTFTLDSIDGTGLAGGSGGSVVDYGPNTSQTAVATETRGYSITGVAETFATTTGPISISAGEKYAVRVTQGTSSDFTIASSIANKVSASLSRVQTNVPEYGSNMAIIQGEYQLMYSDVDDAVNDLYPFDHLVLSHNVQIGDAADSPSFSWPVDTKFGESSSELTGVADTKYPNIQQMIRGCRAKNPRQLIWSYVEGTADAPAGSYAGYGLDSVPAGGGAGFSRGTTQKNISGSIAVDGGTGDITVTTSTAHGWSDNQIVFFFDVEGMTELNNRAFRIDVQSTTTFKLMYVKYEVSDATYVDGSGFTAHSSGTGTVQDYWDEPSAGLQNFKYRCAVMLRDNIDGVFIDLVASQWLSAALRDEVFRIAKAFGLRIMANMTSPSAAGVDFILDSKYFGRGDYIYLEGAIRQSTTGDTWSTGTSAAVTAFDARAPQGCHLAFHYTDEDPTTRVATITGATQANPVVITASNTFSNGDTVRINRVNGMTELNGNNYTVANASGSSFELSGVDGTTYSAFTSSPFAKASIVDDTITSQVYYDTQSATLTASGTTATATVANHGIVSGNSIIIAGANESDYNGTFSVTVVDDDTFTYTMGGSPASPATGTITAKSTKTLVELKASRTGKNAADAFGAGPSGLGLYNLARPTYNSDWGPIGGVIL